MNLGHALRGWHQVPQALRASLSAFSVSVARAWSSMYTRSPRSLVE
jgi:hypothetical protein